MAPTVSPSPPTRLIGYTEFRTNLSGGRQANVATMRACVVRTDGAGRQIVGEELVQEPNAWTQFTGWSPDGQTMVIGRGWESPENAAWEEAHKNFRFSPDGWLIDVYLLGTATGKLTNITAIDRVSHYNSGLFFWPKLSHKLGFQALIDGNSHPFSMDLDGHNKKDLLGEGPGFAYGYSASPDGTLISFHKDYQIYIAETGGSKAMHVQTGQPFNFCPEWSPDGEWLLFLSGEHYNCHPHIVRRDGSGLRKVGDRRGYRGVVAFLDVCDFHGGSSDVPKWSPDGKWIYYTSQVGPSVELMRSDMDAHTEQISRSEPGVLNYHPVFPLKGDWLLLGSNRGGQRQLYVMRLDGSDCRPITAVPPGWGAMWPHWQPK